MPTVVIYWSPGRSAAQQEAVALEITDALVSQGGARKEDVLRKDSCSRGGKPY